MKINEKNLCVFATTPPFDLEGWLNKRGEINKAWQRRYFILKGNLLFYFEKKGDKEPLGLIIVEGCTIELSEDGDQYSFQIVFNGNRSYILNADSQDEMELWMKSLTCAGYEYKKLMVAELQRQLDEIEGAQKKCTEGTAQQVVPKAPPRRQNPFNRPAPAPPASNPFSRPAPPPPPTLGPATSASSSAEFAYTSSAEIASTSSAAFPSISSAAFPSTSAAAFPSTSSAASASTSAAMPSPAGACCSDFMMGASATASVSQF